MDPEDVPAGPLAIDTDAFSFIHYRKDRHAEFGSLVAGHELYLPFPVIGELWVGAIRGRLGGPRRTELTNAIKVATPIPSDARIVKQWADLQARFLSRLAGGGVNDMWIAACCLVYDLPLVTGNLRDFVQIARDFPALRLVHPDL